MPFYVYDHFTHKVPYHDIVQMSLYTFVTKLFLSNTQSKIMAEIKTEIYEIFNKNYSNEEDKAIVKDPTDMMEKVMT